MLEYDPNGKVPIKKFESMLKTNQVLFFDAIEFEHIIQYYIDSGKYNLAKKALKLGMEQHRVSVELQLLQCEILIFESKYAAADKILAKLYAIAPNNEEIFIQKADILSRNGDHLSAISLLEKAMSMTDDTADIHAIIGMEYLFLENFSKARNSFIACLTLDEEDYSSLYNIMYCFDMEEKALEAIAFLEQYIDKNPYNEVAWHQLGLQHFKQNNLKEALRAFDYAILVDDRFVGAYIEKAKVLEKLERYEEAIDAYLFALELEDPTAYVCMRIGICYEKIEAFDKAIKYYTKATVEDPFLDTSWLYLSNLYSEQNDHHKAMYYIQKALDIDSSNCFLWRRFAEINIELSLYEEAVQAYAMCIELGEEAIDVWESYIDVLYFIGDHRDALDIIKKAVEVFPNTPEIEYRYSGLLWVVNPNDTDALYHFKKALFLNIEKYALFEILFNDLTDLEQVKLAYESFKSKD